MEFRKFIKQIKLNNNILQSFNDQLQSFSKQLNNLKTVTDKNQSKIKITRIIDNFIRDLEIEGLMNPTPELMSVFSELGFQDFFGEAGLKKMVRVRDISGSNPKKGGFKEFC